MSKALATITGLSPLWLGVAVGAVALTVAVHMLARARARRIVFPGQRFLEEVAAGAKRRSRPRNVALLGLRALLLSSLALAFDEPGWATSSTRRMPAETVIVIDASASMSRLANGRTLLARALDRAIRWIDEAQSAGAPVGVIVAGAEPDALLPWTTRNHGVLRERVRSIEPTNARADLRRAVETARSLPATDGLLSRRVRVLTDLQATAIEPGLMELSPDVEWVDVGAEAPVANAAIVGLEADPVVAAPGQPIVVTVVVRAFGGFAGQTMVALEAGAVPVGRRAVTLTPGEESVVRFECKAPDGPVTALAARLLVRDALDADNARWAAIVRAETVDATILSSSEQPLLRAALAPDDERRVGLATPNARAILAADAGAIVIEGGALEEDAIEALASRLRDGARAVWFLAGAAGAESFSQFSDRHRLAPAADEPLDAETARFILAAIPPDGAIDRYTLDAGSLTVVRATTIAQLAASGALPILLHALLLDETAAPLHIESALVNATEPVPGIRPGRDSSGRIETVVVTNVDMRESDLASLPSSPVIDGGPIDESEVVVTDIAPLWPGLLTLAFLCLCVEPFTARRARA